MDWDTCVLILLMVPLLGVCGLLVWWHGPFTAYDNNDDLLY